jgi:hypothetical protein
LKEAKSVVLQVSPAVLGNTGEQTELFSQATATEGVVASHANKSPAVSGNTGEQSESSSQATVMEGVADNNETDSSTRGGASEQGVVQLWELEIELITTRTDQIRAQLEAHGLCAVGDELYPTLLWDSDVEKAAHPHGALLDGRVGIHVSRVEVDEDVMQRLSGEEVEYSLGSNGADKGPKVKVLQAGEPWWRTETRATVKSIVDAQLEMLRDQDSSAV